MGANAVATSLAQLTLQPGSTITVFSDSTGTVTQLAVKFFQVRPADRVSAAPILVKRSGV